MTKNSDWIVIKINSNFLHYLVGIVLLGIVIFGHSYITYQVGYSNGEYDLMDDIRDKIQTHGYTRLIFNDGQKIEIEIKHSCFEELYFAQPSINTGRFQIK